MIAPYGLVETTTETVASLVTVYRVYDEPSHEVEMEFGDAKARSLDEKAGLKNKWRWDWLLEKSKDGVPHKEWCTKTPLVKYSPRDSSMHLESTPFLTESATSRTIYL